MKFLIIGGISFSLVNFRGELIKAIKLEGHEVVACSGEPRKDVVKKLQEWGVEFVPVHLSRAGLRPWEDLRTCWELFLLMKKYRPDIVLAYTIKPVIWGGLSARLAGVKEMHALITGLGYAFVSRNGLKDRIIGLLAKNLYLLSLRKCHHVFFQNPDDMKEFADLRLVKEDQCLLLNGSGVDLDYYNVEPLP
jgi:hypothetical protein